MDIIKSTQKIKLYKYITILFIITAIGFLWFTHYKLYGFTLLCIGILVYGFSIKFTFNILVNGGEKEFKKLNKINFENMTKEELLKYDDLIYLYLYSYEISHRLPSELTIYRFEIFSKSKEQIDTFLKKKNDLLHQHIK